MSAVCVCLCVLDKFTVQLIIFHIFVFYFLLYQLSDHILWHFIYWEFCIFANLLEFRIHFFKQWSLRYYNAYLFIVYIVRLTSKPHLSYNKTKQIFKSYPLSSILSFLYNHF